MPRAVGIQKKPSRARDEVQELRRDLIGHLGPYDHHGPTEASTVYVWPTSECPVGCLHCNYASPRSIAGLTRYSVADHPEELLNVVNGMRVWKAVLSGGGEPMVRPDFCAAFIGGVRSDQLGEIELITAAPFASNPGSTLEALAPLVQAWRERKDYGRVKFRVRVSLDWFHAKQIGVEPTRNTIALLSGGAFDDVDVYVRSVLLDEDDTIQRLAESLGASRTKLDNYRETLNLSNGKSVLVYYKNLILDGRISEQRLQRFPISIPNASRVSEFGERFRTPDGKQIPARTYNGPDVVHLDGLACLIEDDGRLRILEGSDISDGPYVQNLTNWDNAIRQMYRDPLTVFLVDEGPEALATLMSPYFEQLGIVPSDSNQLYHLAEVLLDSSDRRMLATLLVIQMHFLQGRLVDLPNEQIAKCWALLDRSGIHE
jgi:hypothetical protein